MRLSFALSRAQTAKRQAGPGYVADGIVRPDRLTILFADEAESSPHSGPASGPTTRAFTIFTRASATTSRITRAPSDSPWSVTSADRTARTSPTAGSRKLRRRRRLFRREGELNFFPLFWVERIQECCRRGDDGFCLVRRRALRRCRCSKVQT